MGYFHNASPHPGMLVKVEFSEGKFTPVEQIFQGLAISAKISRVDEKVRACFFCVVENHRFTHGKMSGSNLYKTSLC